MRTGTLGMRLWLPIVFALCGCIAKAERRPNVLMIAVDDLRPQLGCYGRTQMHSPNIDRLAREGILFERAYCMVPTCGASRASLMTSVRPSRDRFTSYQTWAERDAADAIPLNAHFQQHGYRTISLGKVFHHRDDCKSGWSEPPWRSTRPSYQDRAQQQASIREHKRQYPKKSKHRGLPYEAHVAPDSDYPDGDCVDRAIGYLEGFADQSNDNPFFLCVGLQKPHLPFNAPQAYWALYDPQTIDLPDNFHPPKNVPRDAMHNSGELRAYAGIPDKGPVDRDTAIKLIHGYYACVSFSDAQIGRLLSALEQNELADDTIVCLWGDHGWQLGEHGLWNKHSCFETSMHAPLILRVPAAHQIAATTRIEHLVEFIDVYPTLCDLSGIPVPEHCEGVSLLEQMQNPDQPSKLFAIGRFGTGDTIRSSDFRFSEYRRRTDQVSGTMLYDHRTDPDENENVAQELEKISAELADVLNAKKGK